MQPSEQAFIDYVERFEEDVSYMQERYENRLKKLEIAIAPILKHAESDDKAPPIKFSVQDCWQIKEFLRDGGKR